MVVGDLDTGETYRDMVERIQPYEIPENNGYDPEKALEYFEAALEETGLDSVSVTLIYPSDTGSYKPASEYLQKSWAEIFGADRFQMELQGMPNSQMVGTKKDWINNPNSYEMSWGSWSTSKVARGTRLTYGRPITPRKTSRIPTPSLTTCGFVQTSRKSALTKRRGST